MNFVISFLPEVTGILSTPADNISPGFIKIGWYQEKFDVLLNYWSQSEYQEHWKEAVNHLLHVSPKSCLITSIYHANSLAVIKCWLMYHWEGRVYFQNHVATFRNFFSSFDPKNPYALVPDRKTVDGKGEKIPEWSLPLEDLEEFFNNIR